MSKNNIQLVAEKLANDARWYAKRYDCLLCEAIGDVDYPVTREEVIATLKILGVEVTEENIRQCNPASPRQVKSYQTEEAMAYDVRPGEYGYSD